MEANVKVALELVKTRIWYVVNERTVSTLPNGKENVSILAILHCLPLEIVLVLSIQTTTGGLVFYRANPVREAYVVAGGWLTYQYLD